MTVRSENGGWSSAPVERSIHSPILVIGLGNPILGDDGVGWRVAEGVQARLQAMPGNQAIETGTAGQWLNPDVEIDWLAVGGLALMERLVGYQRAIIIDAITTGQQPSGAVTRLSLAELPERAVGHLSSAHDTSLKNALRLAQSMGVSTPTEITIVGIETDQVYDFSDELSFSILNAIPEAINLVMELLQ